MKTLRELINLPIIESDNFAIKIEAWKDEVKKAHPDIASKLKFKSIEQGKKLCAYVPGDDKCYGTYDIDTATADEEKVTEVECEFKAGDKVKLKAATIKKLMKADPKLKLSDDAIGKVKDTPFGGTKITFAKDFQGKKMWAASDLEAVLTEGSSEYEDSSDFTEDYTSVGQKLDEIKKTVLNKKWSAWMKVTDENFDTKVAPASLHFVAALNDAIEAYKKLEAEMDKAE